MRVKQYAVGMSDEPLPRHLQLLWGLEASGRRGPRPSRTIAEVAEAAIALGDEGGLDAVTMQAVARALGLATMGLYRYVDSRDALLEAVADRIAGAPPEPWPAEAGWRERTRAWALAAAEARSRHAWALDARTPPATTPNVLGWMERGLEAVEPLGLGERGTASALLIVDAYVSGHVRLASGLRAGSPDDAQAIAVRMRAIFDRVVDPARLPRVAAQREVAFAPDEAFDDGELRAGLEIILDGLAASAPASAHAAR